MNRHPHADVIHAWAEGRKIQSRYRPSDTWHDASAPIFKEDVEYRIKPAEPRIVRYRDFVCVGAGGYSVNTITKDRTDASPEHYENLPYFVKWVHDDWQTIEID